MDYNDTFARLGKLTEEMYFNIEKAHHSKMQDQLIEYHAMVTNKLNLIYEELEKTESGELLNDFKKKIKVLIDDFVGMKDDIGNKYKVYLRGCGNAGKSTLLNALLSLDEESGSRMSRLPMTFTIDTYSDEIEKKQAEIRRIDKNGNCTRLKMSREKALKEQDKEEENFKKSKEKCDAIIAERIQGVYLEDIIEDIKHDTYKKNLMQTTIREIKWGIGKNDFFHNCILVDTPGLSQDLRFTNVLEEIKNYEVDGIVWVIASNKLSKREVVEAYNSEFEEFENIYKGKKIIGVVNVYGIGSEYEYGSKSWKKIQKAAESIYCKKYGFEKIILVNAKLAYDGNVEHNSEMLEKSNISELRKKINEMFIEKTTEAHFTEKLKRIDLFVDNFVRELKSIMCKLENSIKEYQDKEKKINNQSMECKVQFQKELASVMTQQMKVINNRIDQNITRVNNLHKESKSSQSVFIKNHILEFDKFEKQMEDITIKNYKKIAKKFEKLQKNSVISNFKTEQYAISEFQENSNMKLIVEEIAKPDLKMPNTMADSVYDLLNDIFGKSVAGIFNGIRNLFVEPKERLLKKVNKSLSEWVDYVNLNSEINDFNNQCMKALNQSMLYTYGAYCDVEEVVKNMKEFIDKKPHMKWVDIKLNDIVGR